MLVKMSVWKFKIVYVSNCYTVFMKKPGNISETVANDGVQFLSTYFLIFHVSRYFSVQIPVSCDLIPHIFVDQC